VATNHAAGKSQDLSKKADGILASYVPSDISARPAEPSHEYHPSAESAAVARELEESPAGRAFRAEYAAIAKRQADAVAGKASNDRGAFSARIEFRHIVGETYTDCETEASGRKGEPLIEMLGSVLSRKETLDGAKQLLSGECIEFDLREVAGAQPTSYQATFQVIAFDKNGTRRVASEAKVVAKAGKPESFTIRKKDGERLEIRLDISILP
jgi:hypothetical protein